MRSEIFNMKKLIIVIPCYNEHEVLQVTAPQFLAKLEDLVAKGKIAPDSRIMFVDDGSTDDTWDIICQLAESDCRYTGISQSRNRGHQSSVLAGLMEAKDLCDITISIDCDGQDDINAMDDMIEEYLSGRDIVYGVRNNRDSDTFFKRFTAECFYKLMTFMGADVIFNHADYRLVSSKVLNKLADFREVNLFLRGLIPLVGFERSCVYYRRTSRLAGESHYPLKKMLALAWDGITSLSVKPIRIIMALGGIFALISIVGIIWSMITVLQGQAVAGWASIVSIICLSSGIQLLCIGVIGEYIGKIYLETKARPRYIISRRTSEKNMQKDEIFNSSIPDKQSF